MSRRFGIATLLYSTDYLPGVFTLGYQLNKLLKNSKDIKTCLIVTKQLYEDDLSALSKEVLQKIFDEIIKVDPLNDQDFCMEQNSANLLLLQRPELAFTFIKARLWELTEFDKVLYLDGDTLPLNEDFVTIFDAVENQKSCQIAGSPDIGWPDMFNSGVLMLVPDREMATRLQKFIADNISIDGADQGILNQFFNPCCYIGAPDASEVAHNEWIRLPFIYNVTMPNYGYQSSPAMKYFESQIRLVHFIGENKPWKGWSQVNPNGYFTRWYSAYKEFQEANQLTQCFQKLSVQEKPEVKFWDPTSYHLDDCGTRWSASSGHSITGSRQAPTPERTFSRETRTETIFADLTNEKAPQHEDIFGHTHNDVPERVFPQERIEDDPTVGSRSTEIAKNSSYFYESSQDKPERVFPQEHVETPLEEGSLKIAKVSSPFYQAHQEEPERVFPNETPTNTSVESSENGAECLTSIQSAGKGDPHIKPPSIEPINSKIAEGRHEPAAHTRRVDRVFPDDIKVSQPIENNEIHQAASQHSGAGEVQSASKAAHKEYPERIFEGEEMTSKGGLPPLIPILFKKQSKRKTGAPASGQSKSDADDVQVSAASSRLPTNEPAEDAASVLGADSPPKNSAIERKLASIREDSLEVPQHLRVFDWEESDYLSNVERTFPDCP